MDIGICRYRYSDKFSYIETCTRQHAYVTCSDTDMYTTVNLQIHTCIQMHERMCICVAKNINIDTDIRAHTYTHTDIHIRMSIYIHLNALVPECFHIQFPMSAISHTRTQTCKCLCEHTHVRAHASTGTSFQQHQFVLGRLRDMEFFPRALPSELNHHLEPGPGLKDVLP